MAGDVMLFMLVPMAGRWVSVGLPMPGLEGAMAGKAELSELKVLSGVMVLMGF